MIPKNFYNVTSQQVSGWQNGLLKLEVHLDDAATEGLFLQLHDLNLATTISPTADTLLKSWPAGQCAYKEFKNGELRFARGLFVALSSTEATYTAAAGASDKMTSLLCELEQEDPIVTTVSSKQNLDPSHNPIGPLGPSTVKRILLDVENCTDGDTIYLVLTDSGYENIYFSKKIVVDTANPIVEINFGFRGYDINQVVNNIYVAITTDPTDPTASYAGCSGLFAITYDY